MGALRKPLSALETILLLAVAILFGLGPRWIGPFPGVIGIVFLAVFLEFVVRPVSTLVHELGHAAAVLCLSDRPTVVIVGRGPWLKMKLGRVQLGFSLLPTRGVTFAGMCRYQPAGLPWRSIALIALAGPFATLVELSILGALVPLLWRHDVLERYILVASLYWLAASLAVNLTPTRKETPKGLGPATVGVRDAWVARHALALHRAGAPPPQPRARPTAQTPQATAQTSVPPPNYVSSEGY